MKPYRSLDNDLLSEQNLRHKLELDKREFCLQMREKAIVNRAFIALLINVFALVPIVGLSAYLVASNVCSSRGNHASQIH